MSDFYQSLGENLLLYKNLIMVYEEKSVNEIFGSNSFPNLYFIANTDGFGLSGCKFVYRSGEVQQEVPFEFCYKNGEHKIVSDNLLFISDLLGGKLSLEDMCSRADFNNKTILGYTGKDNKRDKHWLVRCNTCGSESNQRSRFFNQCRACSEIAKTKTFEEFEIEASTLHNNKYSYDPDNYVNRNTKINIHCNKCDRSFLQAPRCHLSGDGCPYCRESKGELAIYKYCIENNLRFERYKKFDGLVHKKSLNYDFYLIDENILIEFDGAHHRGPVNYNKNYEEALLRFEDVKIKDKIKDDYALSHNIPLLRITSLKDVYKHLDNFRKFNSKMVMI